jgi:ribulose-phosphate 3-epimerase
MTVNPGYGGQTLIQSCLDKVARVKELRDSNPEHFAYIQVDGGINEATIRSAAEAGAEVFVSGTSIFGHPNGARAGIDALRKALSYEKE